MRAVVNKVRHRVTAAARPARGGLKAVMRKSPQRPSWTASGGAGGSCEVCAGSFLGLAAVGSSALAASLGRRGHRHVPGGGGRRRRLRPCGGEATVAVRAPAG